MIEHAWWPTDYFASRARFCEQARSAGARVERHEIQAVGPRGEALSIDIAVFEAPHTEKLVVLSSGVHGVEGFVGASIQVNALQLLARESLSKNINVALIHAVNPWGYAHLRRVNEDNIDVNRNFIDPAEHQVLTNPDYSALDALINPRGAPQTGDQLKYLINVSAQIIRNRGVRKLSKIIATGQYNYPQGLFFGGTAASESNRILQQILLKLSEGVRQVIHLDLHSGLGQPAVATLIANSNADTPERCLQRLRLHYGRSVLFENAKGNAYNAQGTLSQWYQTAFREKRFLYLCVEIGTVNPIRVFSAMRRENQAHHWTASDSKPNQESKQALLRVFAPDSQRWRNNSLQEGTSVVQNTIRQPEILSLD